MASSAVPAPTKAITAKTMSAARIDGASLTRAIVLM
jgi:hypothetical protein